MNKEERKEYMKVYMRGYRKAHPGYNPRTHEADKSYRTRLKEKAVEMLGGWICCECGCTEKRVLEINHIFGGGAKQRRNRYRNFLIEIIRDDERKSKYNILCRVCNAKHYVEEILGIRGHKVTWNMPV